MTVHTLEKEILKELQVVAKNPSLRLKNLMEWSTGEIKAQKDEVLFYLPKLQINCLVKFVGV